MKCTNHPEIDAVGICVKCGKGLCVECTKEIGGKFYCQVCIDVYSQLKPDLISTDQTTQPDIANAPQRTATSSVKERKRKIVGNILIVIGIAAFIVSLIPFIEGLKLNEEGSIYFFVVFIPVSLVSSLLLIIGIGIRFTKSTAALIYGIFGLTGGLCCILAIAFGAMSLSESRQNPSKKGYKASIAGIILGIISILVWTMLAFFWRRL